MIRIFSRTTRFLSPGSQLLAFYVAALPFVLILAVTPEAWADHFLLRNGSELDGRILAETDKKVVIQAEDGRKITLFQKDVINMTRRQATMGEGRAHPSGDDGSGGYTQGASGTEPIAPGDYSTALQRAKQLTAQARQRQLELERKVWEEEHSGEPYPQDLMDTADRKSSPGLDASDHSRGGVSGATYSEGPDDEEDEEPMSLMERKRKEVQEQMRKHSEGAGRRIRGY